MKKRSLYRVYVWDRDGEHLLCGTARNKKQVRAMMAHKYKDIKVLCITKLTRLWA